MWKPLLAALTLSLIPACATAPTGPVNLTVRSDDTVLPAVSNTQAWEKHTPWISDADGVIPLAKGIEYIVLANGDPAVPSPSQASEVAVYYQVRLASDGTFIDEAFGADEAPILNLDSVVDGWREALSQMHPGARWLIYVPAAQAYGRDGSANVPPDSDLIFEVKLLGVTG